ncbi:hypothetical protein SAMN04489761_0032 [Tenacibaculum sp. MAR_2009_124]|nr:hypothetical protein SAMN04489761_0032 [Tenacibaculum sp. MAR_2009_124]
MKMNTLLQLVYKQESNKQESTNLLNEFRNIRNTKDI